MSLILDALNRADQERNERNQTPSVHSSLLHTTPSKHPAKRWLIEIALLAAAGAFYIYTQYDDDKTPVVVSPIQPPAEKKIEPEISTAQVKPVNIPQPNTPINRSVEPAAEISSKPSKAINSLYQKQAVSNSNPPKKEAVASTNLSTPTNSTVQKTQPVTTPVTQTVAEPAAIVATPQATNVENIDVERSIFESMPLLAQMPNRFKQLVPSIDYSVHVYSERDGAGFVKLNGKKQKVGDEVSPGLIVIKILKNSVVLDYKGTQFRLLSLNSWANF